jgi:hypothetical protein
VKRRMREATAFEADFASPMALALASGQDLEVRLRRVGVRFPAPAPRDRDERGAGVARPVGEALGVKRRDRDVSRCQPPPKPPALGITSEASSRQPLTPPSVHCKVRCAVGVLRHACDDMAHCSRPFRSVPRKPSSWHFQAAKNWCWTRWRIRGPPSLPAVHRPVQKVLAPFECPPCAALRAM